MKTAFIFPGQGSQKIEMGKEFFDNFAPAKQVFEEVDEALSQNLSKIIFQGPEDDLNLTENTQPALMATSIAMLRVLETEGGFKLADKVDFVAGHSLGEYSALCAAGVFDVSTTAKLLKIRGTSMQQAVPVGEGGMAAILGAEKDAVQEICDASKTEFANDNAPGQIVISGKMSGIDAAVEIAKEKGLKAVKLPVSAPFHSSMMKPAEEKMREALADAAAQNPSVPVIANVTAEQVSDAEQIKELLAQQVTSQVRWVESINYLKTQGVEQMFEIGSGKVLAGLNKRIDRELKTLVLNAPADMEEILKGLV